MNTSLSKVKDLLRRRRTELVLAVIFFLISTLAFGLGYLTRMRTSHAPIILNLQPSEVE